MNKKKRKRNISDSSKQSSKVTSDLYKYCIFGGQRDTIKKLVYENEYTIAELEEAILVLRENVTSALENNLAEESAVFLRKIINGKKLLDKI